MTFPNMPRGFAATVSGATVVLAWTANPSSDAIIEYQIYRTPTSCFAPVPIAAVSGISYTDSSAELLPSTGWYYFLIAVNASGTSPAAATASVTIPLPLPSAPSGLVTKANSNDTVSLSWNANPASQQVTGYDVYREASGTTSATLLATVAGTTYTDTRSALAPGSSWSYYLEAVNATGVSPASATASVTIPQSQGGGTLIASFEVNNYGSSPVVNPQITFAQPFAPGDVPSGNYIQLRKSDGITVIPVQQDQEATWLQDGSWKTVAISSVSPDTFAAGETITYQLWSVAGSPNRTSAVTLAQLTAATDIRLVMQNAVVNGVSVGDFNPGDVWEVSVNRIVANGSAWPWAQATTTVENVNLNYGQIQLPGTPNVQVGQYVTDSSGAIPVGYVVLTVAQGSDQTIITVAPAGTTTAWQGAPNTGVTMTFTDGPPNGGWELIRSGPLCTEWRFWDYLRCTTVGAGSHSQVGQIHPWMRAVFFVRVWTPGGNFKAATSPIEIGGYWVQSNIFGSNPGYQSAGGWFLIAGTSYQLLEGLPVTSTQTNLDAQLGSGSGNPYQGVGALIVGAGGVPPVLDGISAQAGGSTGATVYLSTSGSSDVVIVGVEMNGAPSGVQSVTSPHLTFQRLAQAGSSPYFDEVWWAPATAPLSNEAITVTGGSGANLMYATAFAVSGVANPSSPFDGNPVLTGAAGYGTPSGGDVVFPTANAGDYAFAVYRASVPNPAPGGGLGPETKYLFQAQLVNVSGGNQTVLMQWGGPNDGNPNFPQSNRTIANIQPSAVNTSNGQITITEAQLNAMLGAASSNFAPISSLGCGGVPVVVSTTAGNTLPGGVVASSGNSTVSNPYWCANYNAGNLVITNGPVLMLAGTKWGATDGIYSLGGNRYDGSPNVALQSFSGAPSGPITVTPLAESFPGMATPTYDWDGRRIWMVNGTNAGVTKPTILVGHDFMYLTTKSRCLPPYLPTSDINPQSAIAMDSSQSPPSPVPYSQGSQYWCIGLNATGDNYGDDRIGWLSFHQGLELYRPFDINLHSLNLGIALSWMHGTFWAIDESHATLPVVNLTQYPNFGAPVGPNVQFHGTNFYLNYSTNFIDMWDWGNANYQRTSNMYNGSHMPSPNIMPYLKSGDFLHYEAMMMLSSSRWFGSANTTCTAGTPNGTNTAGQALGIVTGYKLWSYIDENYSDDSLWTRGMGWVMRHTGTTVHFMPDYLGDGVTPRPEKQYIRDQFHDTVRILDAKTEAPVSGYNTFPANVQSLGAVISEPEYPATGGPFCNSPYTTDIGFIGWAMEAWRGEYSELVDLIANYWCRFQVGRYDESGQTNTQAGPGLVFAAILYNYYPFENVNTGEYYTTFSQCLSNVYLCGDTNITVFGLVNTTAGSPAITLATQFGGLAPNYFVGILGYPNDLPTFTATTSYNDAVGTQIYAMTFDSVTSGTANPTYNNCATTRTTLTTTATGADGGYGTTTLTVASLGTGASAVQVGYGVFDVTTPTAIPIGSANGWQVTPTTVTAINGNTLTLSKPIGFDSNSRGQGQPGVNANDAIMIGPVMFLTSLPFPWPGIRTVIAATSAPNDLHDFINFYYTADTYTNNMGYVMTSTAAVALADCVYRTTGNRNLAQAAAIYAEIRRRQYRNPPAAYAGGGFSLNNSPVYAIGPIGSTS